MQKAVMHVRVGERGHYFEHLLKSNRLLSELPALLKANKVSKMKQQGELHINMHIFFEGALMLFSQNYQNLSMLDETTFAKFCSFFDTQCTCITGCAVAPVLC